MLSKLVRVAFALTAMAPLSVSLAYVFAKDHKYLYAGIAAASCLVLAVLAKEIAESASRKLERMPVKFQKAKPADKEVIGFFITYALPIVFRGDNSADLGAWLCAGMMLLFVLLITHSIQFNPILTFVGFHFYEVETADGITYLLITRRRINSVSSVRQVVQLSEHGIMEIT
jgi:hypothetical protein